MLRSEGQNELKAVLFKLTDKARKALARVEKSGKQINFWGVGEFPEKFTDAVDPRSTPAGRQKLLRGDIEALGGTVLTLQLTGKRHFKFRLKGDSRVVTFVAKDDYVSKIVN